MTRFPLPPCSRSFRESIRSTSPGYHRSLSPLAQLDIKNRTASRYPDNFHLQPPLRPMSVVRMFGFEAQVRITRNCPLIARIAIPPMSRVMFCALQWPTSLLNLKKNHFQNSVLRHGMVIGVPSYDFWSRGYVGGFVLRHGIRDLNVLLSWSVHSPMVLF